MVRVKSGVVTRRRHKKLLESTKGYWMSRHKLVKVAKEASLHAGQYAFAGRKQRKRQFRTLWIIRLNAALSGRDIKYNNFINHLKLKKVDLDRKILAQLAVEYPRIFEKIVDNVMSN